MTKKKYSIVVIGSGFAAYAAISMLLSKNIKPLVLDCIPSKISKKVKNKIRNIPHGNIKQNQFVFFKNIKNHNSTEILSAFNLGGLSNVWGGCINKYHKNEYKEILVKKNEMNLYYNFIDKIFFQLGSNDDYSKNFKLKFLPSESKETLYKILKKKNILKSFQQANVCLGSSRILVDKRKKVLELGPLFKKLIKEKKIKYLNNFEVSKINNFKNKLKLISSRGAEIECEKAYLGAGGFQSTKILINSISEINFAKLNETKLIPSLWFTTSPIKKNEKNAYCDLYLTKVTKPLFHTQFYFINKNLINRIFNKKNFLNYFIKKIFIKFKNHLFFTLSYLDQDYSNKLIIRKLNYNYFLQQEKSTSNLNYLINNFIKKIFKKKIFKIISLKNKNFGYGYHYGSSFPHTKIKKNLSTDYLGGVRQLKNLYLIDSSSLPKIPISTITYTIMANAARIVDKTTKMHKF